MKLEDARAAYYDATGTVSDITRQACFAGIGIVWIFQEAGKSTRLDDDLLYPLLYLILSLVVDLCQYLYKGLIWGVYARWREHLINRKKAKDNNHQVPSWINTPAVLAYWAKVGAALCGYAMIVTLAYKRLI